MMECLANLNSASFGSRFRVLSVHTITFEKPGANSYGQPREPHQGKSIAAEGAHICVSSKLNHKQSTPIMIPLQIASSFTCVALPAGKERA